MKDFFEGLLGTFNEIIEAFRSHNESKRLLEMSKQMV
jgi:hypothetical protein